MPFFVGITLFRCGVFDGVGVGVLEAGHARGRSHYDGIGWDITIDDGTGTDDRVFADRYAWEDDRASPDPYVVADTDFFQRQGGVHVGVVGFVGGADDGAVGGDHRVGADLDAAIAPHVYERGDGDVVVDGDVFGRFDDDEGPDGDFVAAGCQRAAQGVGPARLIGEEDFLVHPAGEFAQGVGPGEGGGGARSMTCFWGWIKLLGFTFRSSYA